MADKTPKKRPIQITKKIARIPYKWNEGGGSDSSGKKKFQGIRKTHGETLLKQLINAEDALEKESISELGEDYLADKGFLLSFIIDAELSEKLDTFESISNGVELLNVRRLFKDELLTHLEVSVFVAHGKLNYFITRLTDYSEKEKNKAFADSIEQIGMATIESLWTSEEVMPKGDDPEWWELWVRRGACEELRSTNIAAVKAECRSLELEMNAHELVLPEHTVLLVEVKKSILAQAYGILNCLAELRAPVKAKLSNDLFSVLSNQEFRPDEIEIPSPPEESEPSVCVLDTGVNFSHPMLSPVCHEDGCGAFHADWLVTDDNGHGTLMCGLAAYGDLRKWNIIDHKDASHWVESLKLFNVDDPHKPEHYGAVTVGCMGRIESMQPNRSNRVFSMAVTAEDAPDFSYLHPEGLPTSWSAAIDSATASALDLSGPRRILVVSGGNVTADDSDGFSPDEYPQINFNLAFADPAHSWNAISVGAITHYCDHSVEAIAEAGTLSPYSRTTRRWMENGGADSPLKPEVVFEGGNVAVAGAPERDLLQPISLNAKFIQESGYKRVNATSASTALAARVCTQIHSILPNVWSETVRALLINSARWNPSMEKMLKSKTKEEYEKLVRVYGYGEPDMLRATQCSSQRTTFYYEEEIQPFHKVKSDIKTKEMIYFPLPIPKETLQDLDSVKVKLSVTLSYFIEPNPGRRVLAKSKFRYANCGLRFDLKTATESIDTFIGNRSGDVLDKLSKKKGNRGNSAKGWTIGSGNQGRGSLHHDIWNGQASDLATRDGIIVYPVSGWWKLRKQLERWDSKQRFSLVVTIETDSDELDVYQEVLNEIDDLTVPQRVRDIQSMFEIPVDITT